MFGFDFEGTHILINIYLIYTAKSLEIKASAERIHKNINQYVVKLKLYIYISSDLFCLSSFEKVFSNSL